METVFFREIQMIFDIETLVHSKIKGCQIKKHLVFTKNLLSGDPWAGNMCKIFSFVRSKKPVTRETETNYVSVQFSNFE